MGKVSKIVKAKEVAKDLKQTQSKGVHKIRTKPRFFRPRTQKTPSVRKTLKSIQSEIKRKDVNSTKLDYTSIIIQPVSSDKNIQKMEKENTMVFLVGDKASKVQIKEAFTKLYGYKVRSVNTLNTSKGKKKAYIRLQNDKDAMNIASKIGIL